MFQQDLAPHEHQDQAAGQLRPGLAPGAHNGPGKLGGNWTWRAAEGFDAEPLASRIQAECEVYCRAEAPVEKEAKTSI